MSATKTRKSVKQPSGFLNVDLEISARSGLGVLADQLSRRMSLLHRGRRGRLDFASFETRSMTETPDATMRALVRVLSKLSPAAMRIWRDAAERDFNIGIETTRSGAPVELALERSTVAEVARLGGRIVFTIYPGQKATRPRPTRPPRAAAVSARR